MSEYIHKSHNVTVLMYHMVLPAKYRRAVFDKRVDEVLKEVCLEIAERYQIKFLEIGTDKDHVHFLVQSVPTYSVTKIVTLLRSITAREVFRRCPHVKKTLWGGEFWTDGYFASTVGKHGDEVRWHFRFSLSLRDIEELLLERGVVVTYETIRRWCEKFGAGFAQRAKAVRRKPGRTSHLDEMFVTLRGKPHLLWRTVDEHGAELDVLVRKRRDKAAAKRFFRRVLRSNPVPRKVVTDQLPSYPAAKADIPELAQVKHVFVKAAARVNNRAENSHQPTRRRERQMCGFRDARRTQAFLSRFGPIRQHFALPRHQMNAACHRAILKERLAAWHGWTVADAIGTAI